MQECIDDNVPRAALNDRSQRFWRETKASTDFLDVLFEAFFKKLGLPNLMRKTDYHVLARFMAATELDREVSAVFDQMYQVASRAKSVSLSS